MDIYEYDYFRPLMDFYQPYQHTEPIQFTDFINTSDRIYKLIINTVFETILTSEEYLLGEELDRNLVFEYEYEHVAHQIYLWTNRFLRMPAFITGRTNYADYLALKKTFFKKQKFTKYPVYNEFVARLHNVIITLLNGYSNTTVFNIFEKPVISTPTGFNLQYLAARTIRSQIPNDGLEELSEHVPTFISDYIKRI
jgi:hypothetical protein